MQNLWHKIAEVLLLTRLKKRWQKVATILAVVVVFCTTYMLILPAITLEVETCGFDEHSHSDNCYTIESSLLCTSDDFDDIENEHLETTIQSEKMADGEEEDSGELLQYTHEHTEECYIYERVLICTLEEHLHQDDCFDTESTDEYDENHSENLMNNSLSDEHSVQPMAETDSTATKVNFDTLDGSGETYYIMYTYHNGNYYAIDGNGSPVSVTLLSDGSVTSSSMGNNLYWNFTLQSDSTYIIQNLGTSRYMHSYYNSSTDYGVTTAGAWSSSLEISENNETVCVKSNSYYPHIVTSRNSVAFQTTTTSDNAAQFYLAQAVVPRDVYHVWFDGTCGGIMSLYEAGNIYQAVPSEDTSITLPTTCESPSKYDYILNGWYDIKNNKYYKPGDSVTITRNTVFYADWIAKTYDVGQNNDHVVPSLDTNSFIKTNMFDYSAIFNMQAVTHTGTVSAAGHDETWMVVQNDNVQYNDEPSLGFIFRDWDSASKHISYAGNRDRLNDNQGTEITSQITDYVYDMSGKSIIDILFNPQTDVIGKTHVGEANYLYQFMEDGSSNYDGIHNGYYYYDATLNAASYNQTDKRFYIYDYLERTSDSLKDGFDSNGNPTAGGSYSDFLPFNSPYANNSNNKTIVDYADKNGEYGNYQYDAKSDHEGSSAENAGTNYWFGMKSEIKFYLPNDTGTVDDYGNYGNISTHGEHMNFQFHGDDDMWVFIDGELVMDVGGLHGIMNGKIDFSTGKVTTDYAENNSLVATPTETEISLKEGDHTLTIYYMERGGSQSNCAIYFNIAPRYAMEITKQDDLTNEKLNGAQFSVFTDESCTVPAELWNSEKDYQNDEPSTNVFTVENGKAYLWGISPGKVYYIKETKSPDGYPVTDDIVRVAMNNLGGWVCTTDSLRGEDEEHTDGFNVLQSDTDETIHLLYITLTNQKEKTEETGVTNVRVSKNWDADLEDIPESITVYLTANENITGQAVTLNEANGWSYTWTGLPEKNNDGVEIVYNVHEIQVPGFSSVLSAPQTFSDDDEWIKTDSFRDGDTFILVDARSGNALSVSGGNFTWISRSDASNNTEAQWTSVADGMGFLLENASGYRVILDNTSEFIPGEDGNRTLYFYNSKLFAQSDNVYYYFDSDGTANSQNALEFELYKKSTDKLSGTLFEITNTYIPQEKQTFLNVTKTWSDGDTTHLNNSITVRLYEDGKDTGRELTLNRSNGWTGTFDGLLYSLDGSDTPIVYTVVENSFPGYVPEYSEITSIPGQEINQWTAATTLEAGKIYRFVTNGYALASNSNNAVTFAAEDMDDTYQQWLAVQSGSNITLQNVGNERYLYRSSRGNSILMNNSSGSNVTLNDNKLTVNNRYIVFNSNSASTTTNSSNATTLAVATQTTVVLTPGYEINVNNIKAEYTLPETGGTGVYVYTISGLTAMLGAALLLYRKKRRANM